MYRVANGYNNSDEYANLIPQPHCAGIVPGRVTQASDGREYIDGDSHAILEYKNLPPDELSDIFMVFGFNSAHNVEVTISLPTNADRTVFADYNCIAIKPSVGNYNYEMTLWRDIKIRLVRILEVES